MVTKNLYVLLVAFFLSFVAGCGGVGSSCLPALPANSMICPTGVFIDATATDPVCLAAGGVAICRGNSDAICYRCNGSSFSDGCLIKNAEQTIECVHGCSKC
jgi:hypothetical protein